ncbi:MAG: 6,7-dimethyl-8-ribityllumazine synthase [Gammaproteobacteria bacterium]|jgi:6,7-dimethyl-8-ribityllumazine synthase|nr:6,7-dimethyl-8-ribityllumazine synthase [Gammaproteobacteria bacterium]
MSGVRGAVEPVNEIARQAHYVLLAARFNDAIVSQLIEGARAALLAAGVAADNIEVLRVPGAFELPQAAASVIGSGRADAIIALGTVIRGETAHFEYVSGSCAHGLSQVGAQYGIPVLLGVLTTENQQQAKQRAALDGDNKGAEVAHAALQMVALYAQLDSAVAEAT